MLPTPEQLTETLENLKDQCDMIDAHIQELKDTKKRLNALSNLLQKDLDKSKE